MKTKMGFEVERQLVLKDLTYPKKRACYLFISLISEHKINFFLSVFNIIFDRNTLIFDEIKGVGDNKNNNIQIIIEIIAS